MKRLGLALALVVALSCAAAAQIGGLMFPGPGPRVASAAYTGPLDIAPSAQVAYCLRACSAANIGGNVIDIQRASDSTTQTFVSLSTGALDIASITTFLTSTTGKVTKWWDQSGHSNHATSLSGFTFTISASGLGTKPAVTFNAESTGLLTGSTVTAAQPAFVSGVANRRSGTNFTALIGAPGAAAGLLFENAANGMTIFGGSLGSFTVADGTFHAIGADFNDGASASQGFVNGTGLGVVTAGTTGFGAQLEIGFFSATALVGDICEVIVWASDQSANASALSANQRSASGYNF